MAGERDLNSERKPRGPKRETRFLAVFALAVLCLASTGAGVGAAIFLGRVGPAIRMPAAEPGRAVTVPRSGGGRQAGLPRYEAGDRFVFTIREPSSSGEPIALERRWEVEAVHGDRIDWNLGRASLTTTLNPLAPALKWRATEEGEGSRQLLGDPLGLFPLEKGKKSSLSSIGGGAAASFRDEWTCETTGQDQVTVAAGSFRAWKVECASQSGSAKDTYYFSDEIGFWVSRLSRYQRGSQTVERVYELTASSRLHR